MIEGDIVQRWTTGLQRTQFYEIPEIPESVQNGGKKTKKSECIRKARPVTTWLTSFPCVTLRWQSAKTQIVFIYLFIY